MPFGHRHSRRRLGPGKSFVRLLFMQPLWAVPFALFFWALFSSWTLAGLWRSYLISLVFAYSIGYSIWAVEVFVVRRLGRPKYKGGHQPLAIEVGTYTVAAVLGGLLGATLNHFFVLPGFLGSARSMITVVAFTLLFVSLFTGVTYAMVFYRQSIARARAVEAVRAELAQAELRALRAQIHPHFLFNTLNSIASLIPADPVAAEDMTTRLAEIFRYTLRASDHESTALADELRFLSDYLAIERARLGDRLIVEFEVEAEVTDARVPSLLLQPIVENAVKYGVAGRPGPGRIVIAARRTDTGLLVEVRDDGPGFDREAAPSGTGFGLHSVQERLRAGGHPDALTIETEPGRGTCVRLTLPWTAVSTTP
jgi:signal transduction histidine kinase